MIRATFAHMPRIPMPLKNRLQLGIRGRLYLLVALFGLGCVALAAILIWLQTQQAFEARKHTLTQLVAVANGVLAAHKELADSGQMPVEEAKKRALKIIGTMWYGKTARKRARSATRSPTRRVDFFRGR
jgi:hypothetical protein